MSLIAWFEGKKTYLGMGMVLVAYLGRMLAPQLEAVWVWLDNAGMALGAVGVADKTRRAVTTGDGQ